MNQLNHADQIHQTHEALNWLATEQSLMIALLEKWANMNTGSDNTSGINAFRQMIEQDFAILGGTAEVLPLPPRHLIDLQGTTVEAAAAAALRITKRREAPIQIFLGGHMDTVFSPSSPFQHTSRLNENTLQGPGVADMKGGLAILLKGLEAFERSPYASQIGWEIVLNPDEEIGSPSSDHLFIEAAHRNQLGLIFEPAYSDGAFVSARKGSANFVITAKGRASHAGRDFHVGKSAIYAIADAIQQIENLNHNPYETTVNVGFIQGGGPVNIVPDFALCRLNVRLSTQERFSFIRNELQNIVASCQKRDGIEMALIEQNSCPPKPFDEKTQALFKAYQTCAAELNIPFHLRESGGVCDGNRLAAQGLPTLDTAGAVGGNIHTEVEYVNLNSLTERAQLLTFFLIRLATGDLKKMGKDKIS
jgi:glutamate carboxypeptidase